MRRFFLLVSFISFLCIPLYSQPKQEMRAIWLTNVDSQVMLNDASITQAMEYLSAIGFNVVFPVVWNKGYTLYPSAVMNSHFGRPIDPSTAYINRDPLARIVFEGRRLGLEVIPWFEFGFSSSYSLEGGHIVARYPHWASKMLRQVGVAQYDTVLTVKNGFDWLAGTNPNVQNFLLSLITEVLDNYDVDGVQGDDRLPAMPIEGGYDSTTVAIFRSENNGATPPAFNTTQWQSWRAAHLSRFAKRVRDSVKARGAHLIWSSSPSPYAWGLMEYLQDSKTWVDSGYVDHIIPQLYRYDLNSFHSLTLQQLNHVPVAKRDMFFGGVLTKSGSYVITPSLLTQKLQYLRDNGVRGESHFFYEALRANNGVNGDTLRNGLYKDPAITPWRNGNLWRPKAETVNENDSASVSYQGMWERWAFPGFRPGIVVATDTGYKSIEYSFNVPATAHYDVYAYIVANTIFSAQVPYTLSNGSDSITISVNQSATAKTGWVKVGTMLFYRNGRSVVRLTNQNIGAGKRIMSDAVIAMINRKLSPDAVITSVETGRKELLTPRSIRLEQNFPNPFNPVTTIRYALPERSMVRLTVHDILGREVALLQNGHLFAGEYTASFDGRALPSGVYFYTLSVVPNGTNATTVTAKKMLMVK